MLRSERSPHSYQPPPERSFFQKITERLSKPKIEDFSAFAVFEKYLQDLQSGISRELAKERRRALLSTNIRTYTQEGIGAKHIHEYGTLVSRAFAVPGLNEQSDRIVFSNLFYNDVIAGQHAQQENEPHPLIRDRYKQEFSTWERSWQKLLLGIEQYIGYPDKKALVQELLLKGFIHRNSDEHALVSEGLQALLPSLGDDAYVEMYEHPERLILTSPRFFAYHKGETSIARHMRLVYIPKTDSFVFLEAGFFTAYKNHEIAQFHTLAENHFPLPESPTDILAQISILAQAYKDYPPHALFSLIVEKLGHFPEVPVGENVITTTERSFDSQIEYLESIFDFEEQLLSAYPHLYKSIRERLAQPTETIMHSALRANTLNVEELLQAYKTIFSDPLYAQNPLAAKNILDGLRAIHYPDIGTRVTSLIDCGTGTVLGGMKNLSPTQLTGKIDGLFGAGAIDMLSTASQKGISSESELRSFCNKFGLDHTRFHTGVCRTDGCRSTYVGECSICPACEMKYTLGLMDEHGNTDSHDHNETIKNAEIQEKKSRRPTTIGTAVASVTNVGLLKESIVVYDQ